LTQFFHLENISKKTVCLILAYFAGLRKKLRYWRYARFFGAQAWFGERHGAFYVLELTDRWSVRECKNQRLKCKIAVYARLKPALHPLGRGCFMQKNQLTYEITFRVKALEKTDLWLCHGLTIAFWATAYTYTCCCLKALNPKDLSQNTHGCQAKEL
jgi:hypothetical protein